MVDVKKVPPDMLLNNLAETFKGDKRVEVPEWASYLKAGIHREKSWEDPDWYYKRLASTLRKVYLNGPIGISKLSEEYGGRVDRGSISYHPAKGSRFIVRKMLLQLESLGYVKKDRKGAYSEHCVIGTCPFHVHPVFWWCGFGFLICE